MPTIKDIAEYAGVSHGTVSNVLNKKGNVSVEKINIVEQAARDLGYYINAQAKQLRQGHSKRICVVLPYNDIKKYNDLFDGIQNEFRGSEFEVDVYYTEDRNYEEERLLELVASIKPIALVIISSHVKKTNIFSGEVPIIFVERQIKKMPDNGIYIGFDYYLAGKQIAQRCLKENRKRIAVYCEDEKYSNNQGFVNGIKDILDEEDVQYQCFQSLDLLKLQEAFNLSYQDENYDAVIVEGIERVHMIQNIFSYVYHQQSPHIYALTDKSMHLNIKDVSHYDLNYKFLGKQIAKYILANNKDETILFNDNDGFQTNLLTIEKKRDVKINFLSLTSPTTKAIKYLLPEFKRKTGIEVNLIEVAYDELQKAVSSIACGKKNPYDLIRIDMAWLNLYGPQLFKSLDLEVSPYKEIIENFSNVFSDEYFKVADKVYALPLDPSVQVLYYRKDLFEDALICRAFYERYKRQLTIPTTFKEFDEVAEFFTKEYNPHSPTRYGVPLTYGTAAVAACDFLPRWKEYGVDLLDEDKKVSLDNKTMKMAMEEYIQSMCFSDSEMRQWWNHSMELFAKGTTAMDIGFSNHATAIVLNPKSVVAGKVGFAAVPGKEPLLGGGIIGLSKDTQKEEACEMFLKWVYSEQVATLITTLGGYINHKKLIQNQDILQLYPWLSGMEKAFCIGARNCVKEKEFKEVIFENILGEAVRLVALGLQTVDEALKEAQSKCIADGI